VSSTIRTSMPSSTRPIDPNTGAIPTDDVTTGEASVRP
jgi:hypothetical protein